LRQKHPQDFTKTLHDFNFRVTTVTPRDAIALDHSDPYIGLANELGSSDLINRLGGMERRAASLGKKSTAIIVQQNLVKFVRAATEGEAFAGATANAENLDPKLTPDTVDFFRARLLQYLDGIVRGMGEAKFKDRESLHITAPGWAALGIVFNDIVRSNMSITDAAAKIGQVDWHRSAPEWADLVKAKGNVIQFAAGGAQVRRYIVRKLRDLFGIVHVEDKADPVTDAEAA
jgi:hypothetical protein